MSSANACSRYIRTLPDIQRKPGITWLRQPAHARGRTTSYYHDRHANRTIPTSDDSISPPAPKHACTSVSKSRVQKSSRAQCGRATNLNRLLGKGREHRCSERRDHLHTCCVPPSSFRTVACETRARASRIVPYVAPPREPGRFFQWSGLHGLQLQHILLLHHRRRLLSSIAAPSLP